MRMRVAILLVGGLIVGLTGSVSAQEATVSGVVSDTTGGVLPGVTVTAIHEASGNTFVGVTDERGGYQIPLRTGSYRITAELSGFATVTGRLELVVGQQASLNFKMPPGALQETVTVTGDAALISVTQSNLSGNIDTRQMQEIPINGRNWMQLTLLAAGSRSIGTRDDAPVDREYGGAVFQFNIDGQQVTGNQGQSQSGEPRFSRDAIAEFELATTRFDATQGRSSGVLVNAVTKSGTNTVSGSFAGFFRDDRFKAADPVVNRVLNYSNQQYSTTLGGPIKKDKAHLFGYYEFEREPQTVAFNSRFPRFNVADLTATRIEHKGGVRFDTQFSSRANLMVRANRWTMKEPFADRCAPSATRHPSSLCGGEHSSDQLFLSLTQTLSNRAVNEIKAGYTSLEWNYEMNVTNGAFNPRPSGCEARWRLVDAGLTPGLLTPRNSAAPAILLQGYSLGTMGSVPHCVGEDTYSIRDNFTYVYGLAGRHQLKTGAEYLRTMNHLWYPSGSHGLLDATGGPVPGNVEDLFPVWDDWTTWNLEALSPITRFYRKAFGNPNIYNPVDIGAAWVQDDWTIGDRLTLNLGVRYDVALGGIGDRLDPFPPFRPETVDPDLLNFGPRFGAAYKLGEKTVIRGGWGKYYAQPINFQVYIPYSTWIQVTPVALNDRTRPNFAADPYNGVVPTYDSIVASGVRRDISMLDPVTYHTQHSYQMSAGAQRQIGETMAFQADYVYTASRGEGFSSRNSNLSYNPATGANYPFTDVTRLPYPDWGTVTTTYGDGWSNYHALQTAFTKRFSNRWQASANYTLSGFWDAVSAPDAGFPLAADFGGEYTLGVGDQRHRGTLNGIWDIGRGFQLSGLYFYGSGLRYSTSWGVDLRQVGASGQNRLRPDGSIVPRNGFVGDPIHRVDARLQKRFRVFGRVAADGILEVFNLFDHSNFGSYTTTEVSPAYGRPNVSIQLPFQPRMAQFAFRLAF